MNSIPYCKQLNLDPVDVEIQVVWSILPPEVSFQSFTFMKATQDRSTGAKKRKLVHWYLGPEVFHRPGTLSLIELQCSVASTTDVPDAGWPPSLSDPHCQDFSVVTREAAALSFLGAGGLDIR